MQTLLTIKNNGIPTQHFLGNIKDKHPEYIRHFKVICHALKSNTPRCPLSHYSDCDVAQQCRSMPCKPYSTVMVENRSQTLYQCLLCTSSCA